MVEWSHIKLKKVRDKHPQPPIPQWFWQINSALNRLEGDRINTQGVPGCIPFQSAREYMDWLGVEDQETFLELLQAADREYVRLQTKKLLASQNRTQIGGK